jgi:uncharacterized protein
VVFVDTSVWYPWFVPTDAQNARVTGWLDANEEPLITTDFVVDETLTLLVTRKHVHRALDAGRGFFHHGVAKIHFLTPAQIHRAWILFQQRAASGWSFTDCTSKVVIDDLQIATAAALDEHFRQFGNVSVVP